MSTALRPVEEEWTALFIGCLTGSEAAVVPEQIYSAYYDAGFQSYWLNGVQYDVNSGNAFALSMAPDMIQGNLLSQDQICTFATVATVVGGVGMAAGALTADPILFGVGFVAVVAGTEAYLANCLPSTPSADLPP